MENELIEICPICIEKPAEYYTECGHCYCIGCLTRIKKCAMCRNPLQRAKICIQIKRKVKLINEPYRSTLIYNSSEEFSTRNSMPMGVSRGGDLNIVFRHYTRVTLPELPEQINNTRLIFNHRTSNLIVY